MTFKITGQKKKKIQQHSLPCQVSNKQTETVLKRVTGFGGSDCLYIRAADYLHHCYTCKMDMQTCLNAAASTVSATTGAGH